MSALSTSANTVFWRFRRRCAGVFRGTCLLKSRPKTLGEGSGTAATCSKVKSAPEVRARNLRAEEGIRASAVASSFCHKRIMWSLCQQAVKRRKVYSCKL